MSVDDRVIARIKKVKGLSCNNSNLEPDGFNNKNKGTTAQQSQDEIRQYLCNLVEQAYYAGQHNNANEMLLLVDMAVRYSQEYSRLNPANCEIVLDGKRYILKEKSDA